MAANSVIASILKGTRGFLAVCILAANTRCSITNGGPGFVTRSICMRRRWVAPISLWPPGKDLREGMAAADRLLKAESATTILEPGLYGTVNSIRNHSDLCAGAPLTLALARSGAYTEWRVGRILEVFTGGGQVQSSCLQRMIADRPALAFPYQPFAGSSYRRIKPGNTPCGGKMKFATPFGAARNELFLAGRIVNRWSEAFYRSVLANVNYDPGLPRARRTPSACRCCRCSLG